MHYGWHRFSVAEASKRIQEGVPPWVSIGDFLDDYYRSAVDDRLDLVRTPPQIANGENVRWIAVCAAAVEHLCTQDGLPVPSWVIDPQYSLSEPWYFDAKTSDYKQWLEETTLPSFRKRNIMAGDRVLLRS